MVLKKTRRCNKARFLKNTLKKTPSSGESIISTYSISISLLLKSISEFSGAASLMCDMVTGGGRGRLFEAGRLLTFSAFRMGAYLRWALIRGWAFIRIITVTELAPIRLPLIIMWVNLNNYEIA